MPVEQDEPIFLAYMLLYGYNHVDGLGNYTRFHEYCVQTFGWVEDRNWKSWHLYTRFLDWTGE